MPHLHCPECRLTIQTPQAGVPRCPHCHQALVVIYPGPGLPLDRVVGGRTPTPPSRSRPLAGSAGRSGTH